MNTFESVLAEITRKDTRYSREAYLFAQEALDHAVELRDSDRQRRAQNQEEEQDEEHIGGQHLCEAFRQLAFERFGLLTLEVLHTFGLHETLDLGNIVFNLIEAGAMRASGDDQLADFENVYSFEDAFSTSVELIP